jgi:hypothetical protein
MTSMGRASSEAGSVSDAKDPVRDIWQALRHDSSIVAGDSIDVLARRADPGVAIEARISRTKPLRRSDALTNTASGGQGM